MRLEKLRPQTMEIKRHITDPVAVARALGLIVGARPQEGGVMVRCPWHPDRSPSCSLSLGPDGTLRVKCFGCGKGSDVFGLTAHVLGLDVRREFPRVVQETAAMCGVYIGNLSLQRRRPPTPLPTPPPARRPPPLAEVKSLWEQCLPVCENPTLAREIAELRCLDPVVIADRDLARSLPSDGKLPGWARCSGHSWRESGHHLIVPLFDPSGNLASVHARSLKPGTNPKGLSPAGYSSASLVMACNFAKQVIRTGIPSWWRDPMALTFIVAEGVPDFLTNASYFDDWEYAPATIGVISGAWSQDIAARIPDRARVVIRTHDDQAGHKYMPIATPMGPPIAKNKGPGEDIEKP